MQKVSTKRIVRAGFFTALALIMSLLENALPPLFAFAPGVKLGLANVVSLIAIIILGYPDAFAILIVRCFLASVFGNNIGALMYSLPAGLASLALQALMYKFLFPKVSIISISLAGAAVHNMVQLLVATLVVGASLAPMLPLMLIAGLIAGLFVGIVTWFTIRYLPKNIYLY